MSIAEIAARKTAPYGTWASPISAAQVAAAAKVLSGAQHDGDDLYWHEGVVAEGGRLTVMRRDAAGATEALVPAPFNVRTRVHEYGGGAWRVDAGVLYFSNFADNLVHRRSLDGVIEAITGDRLQRHADFEIDRTRGRLLCVREDHGVVGEARTTLVSLDVAGGPEHELAAGHDFYAAPRLSPDGARVAWLAWNHPQMPWDGTELWVADVAADGSAIDARRVAGGPDTSLFQPRWSEDGALHVVSDESGWWNLARIDGDRLVDLCPMEAEFGEPAWAFGQSMYDFDASGDVVAIAIVDGVHRLCRIPRAGGAARAIETGFSMLDALSVRNDTAYALASSPRAPTALVAIDLDDGTHDVVASSVDHVPDARYLSTPRRVRFMSGGRPVHAIFHPPVNADFAGPADERPPVIVQGHGGPTAMTNDGLRLGVHYWTSRGFALLDIDYVGSSGYGRSFRRALQGRWGVADVDDFVAGARHVADEGLVDRARMTIRGASASGLTTLCGLAFHDVFRAGAVAYGVSDIAALIAETHKFESRYGRFLVGSLEDDPVGLAARSPLHHADRIQAPVILFQGLDDRVVPPSQSEAMAASLQARGIPVAYLAFEGEGHGFRRFDTLVRVVEAELAFYAHVFGFTPADVIAPVPFLPAS